MRGVFFASIAAVSLWSVPAEASHWYFAPYVGFGYGFYGHPYGPWFGPHVGVGVRIGPFARRAPRAAVPEQQGALKLYVYPAAGQSEAQTADDRYQCHVWAADESGHDPALGTGTRADAENYTRAFTACMEGRNYVVR